MSMAVCRALALSSHSLRARRDSRSSATVTMDSFDGAALGARAGLATALLIPHLTGARKTAL